MGAIHEWVSNEFCTLSLRSKRLEQRVKIGVSQIASNISPSIWLASGDRSEAKAFYRMLANDKFEGEALLSAHADAIKGRYPQGVVLAVQDTMAVNYATHKKTQGMGHNCEQTLGLNVHSCLALTPTGVPLGLLSQEVSTRLEKEDTLSKDQKKGRPIEEKERYRWLTTMTTAATRMGEAIPLIHIADREGDIYELFAQAMATKQWFLIRAVHHRLTMDGEDIVDAVRAEAPLGSILVTLPENRQAGRDKEREVGFTVRVLSTRIKKPARRKKPNLASSLPLTLLYLQEEGEVSSREPIEWLLMTNLPIDTPGEALIVAGFYHHRWKIERFHFVLKSGCQIEKIQQRSVDRMIPMILLYSIISIHIMFLTYASREEPFAPCSLVFSDGEWKTLFRAARRTPHAPDHPFSLVDAVKYVAQLAGFRGAPSDGPPGLKVLWMGMNRLYCLLAYSSFL